jgi:uncharacterized membrane protein
VEGQCVNVADAANRERVNMLKNVKDVSIIILVIGLVALLGLIVVGDFWIALVENRPVDESVINLLKMAITGIVGIVAGYVARSD